jgi:hypothetical protein
VLLGVMFIGITVLANHVVIAGRCSKRLFPKSPVLYGISPMYYITLAATTVI